MKTVSQHRQDILTNLARFACWVTIAIGALATLGHLLGSERLQEFLVGAPPSRLAAVLGLCAVGFSQLSYQSGKFRRSRAVAIVIGILAAASVVRIPAGLGFEPVSTMAAIGFLLSAASLLGLSSRSEGYQNLSLYLAGLMGAMGMLALIGIAFRIPELYSPGRATAVSLPVALGFALAGFGTVFARADSGLMRLLITETPGGALLRRTGSTMLVISTLLLIVILLGQSMGLYEGPFSVALLAVGMSLAFIAMTIQGAGMLNATERRARASEEDLRLMIEAVHDYAFLRLDPMGRIIRWNPGATKLFGYSREEVMGAPSALLFTDEDRKRQVPGTELEIAKKNGRSGDNRWHRRKDGSVFYSSGDLIALHYPHSGELAGYFKIMRDFTDRKRAEEELKEAKESAEAASRTKSAFLANMSHEIRTPIGAIMGFTALLKDPRVSSQDRELFASTIEKNGHQLLRVIDDILDISKVEAGRLVIDKTRVPLIDLLNEVIATFKIQASRKDIELTLHLGENLPESITTDPMRLRQILVNVVGNALKFTERGSITVSAEMPTPERLALRVSDTGIGIGPVEQTRLFQPFTQADSSVSKRFGGTGLGLALSQRLSQCLGGDLKLISSAPGFGSVFEISIHPGAIELKRASPKNEEVARNQDGATLSGLSILVAEDNPDNQLLFRTFLETAGAAVQIARNGKQAIDAALSKPFNVVLMDIQMPEMSGYEATRELRSRGFKTPILALTAFAMKEEQQKAKEAGFTAHLSKPVERKTLLSKIASLVGRMAPSV